MSGRAPANRDPALRFDALRSVALREGGGALQSLAAENEGEILIGAPAHVHSPREALCCWRKLSAHSQLALRTCTPAPAHASSLEKES
jgi:hypothetical protein